MNNAHLELTGVGISFPTDKGLYCALQNVNLRIAKGEFVSLIGHSGCGKSTVLNIVAGLYQATTGGVILDGREVNEPGPERAVVFQNHSLLPWLSCYENAELAVRQVFKGQKNRREMRDWIEHNLELVHMTHARDKRPSEISGGMKQRIGIARALAMDPDLIIADEAVSALDVSIQAQVLDLLRDLRDRLNLSILFITHDLRVAAQLCDRIAVMQKGKLVEIGTVHDIFLSPRQDYTRQLLAAVPGGGWAHDTGLPA